MFDSKYMFKGTYEVFPAQQWFAQRCTKTFFNVFAKITFLIVNDIQRHIVV